MYLACLCAVCIQVHQDTAALRTAQDIYQCSLCGSTMYMYMHICSCTNYTGRWSRLWAVCDIPLSNHKLCCYYTDPLEQPTELSLSSVATHTHS